MSDNGARFILAVGIATAGRRDILSAMTGVLARQTRLPDLLIVCPAESDDVDPGVAAKFPAATRIVSGPRGLCAQRNAILSAITGSDAIVFFDDDFLPHPSFLAEAERLFTAMPDVVAATGHVLADGVTGPGLSFEQGLHALGQARLPQNALVSKTYNAYGCNMGFRLAPVREHRLLFDEALPLYGWQEDVDFCRQLAPYGRIVQSPRLLGVHLGAKNGRTSGVRFGYSQIANPVYLARKGTLARWRAGRQMARNIAANLAHVAKPEPWVDRRGRVKGNVLAFRDWLAGRLAPQRILDMK